MSMRIELPAAESKHFIGQRLISSKRLQHAQGQHKLFRSRLVFDGLQGPEVLQAGISCHGVWQAAAECMGMQHCLPRTFEQAQKFASPWHRVTLLYNVPAIANEGLVVPSKGVIAHIWAAKRVHLRKGQKYHQFGHCNDLGNPAIGINDIP